jgi:hypothetical protein
LSLKNKNKKKKVKIFTQLYFELNNLKESYFKLLIKSTNENKIAKELIKKFVVWNKRYDQRQLNLKIILVKLRRNLSRKIFISELM